MRIYGRKRLGGGLDADADRVIIELPTILLVVLLMVVSVSSCLLGYFIGRSVHPDGEVDGYTGKIVDNLPIRFGRLGEEQVWQVYVFAIHGRVIYTDGTPYAHGTVELRSEVRYTVTDENGWFRFDNVTPGRHRISVIEDEVVLASCEVIVERSSHITAAAQVRFGDGTELIEIPIDVHVIELLLEFDRKESRIYVREVREVKDGDLGGPEPGGPPGAPGKPEEPGRPDTPGEPGGPGEGEIPEEAGVPEEPEGPEEPGPPELPDDPGEVGQGPAIIVTDEVDPSRVWTQSTAVDIFAERPGNTGVRTIDGKNVIVPGAKGRYVFRIENTEASQVVYWVRLREVDRNHPPLYMEYKLRRVPDGVYLGGDSWKRAGQIAVDGHTLAPGESEYYALEWRWDTGDDALDTAIGSQEVIPPYILEIVITAAFM